jgi:hypothetical protein
VRPPRILTCRLNRILAGTLSVITASSLLLSPPPLHGQAVQISRGTANTVNVIYRKAKGVPVQVEQSTDLVWWEPTSSFDKLIGQDATTETIRARIMMGSHSSLFFRVPVTLYRDVTLAWDPSAGPAEIAGYRLYYGPESEPYRNQFDVGNQTTVTVSLPDDGRVYFFVVVAYTNVGVESLPSDGVASP